MNNDIIIIVYFIEYILYNILQIYIYDNINNDKIICYYINNIYHIIYNIMQYNII
jgi:hypothetical protein